jgi:hypothetical protein
MMSENLAKTLTDEKYSKKRVTKCKDGHCIVTVREPKE